MANDNNIQPMADDSQIVLYQPDESISLHVVAVPQSGHKK